MTDRFQSFDASRLVVNPLRPETSMKVQLEFDNFTYIFTGGSTGEPANIMSNRHKAVAKALLQSALDELGEDNAE